jgi:hypothetical protein
VILLTVPALVSSTVSMGNAETNRGKNKPTQIEITRKYNSNENSIQ